MGAAMGPLLSSIAMQQYGPGGLFSYAAVAAFLLGLFCIHRLLAGQIVHADDKEDFVAVPKTSQVAVNMAAAVSEEQSESD